MKNLFVLLIAIVLCGCAGIWGGIITVTQVRDTAMKELATLYKAGKISPETEGKIYNADARYRQAAELAAKTLEASKVSGDRAQYIAALEATKTAVVGILDILTPLISQQKAVEFNTQLRQAKTL